MIRNRLLLLSIATPVLLALGACRHTSRLERIAREARTFTEKQCPFNVDQYTRLDSTTFDTTTRCYYYNYTVNGILDNDSVYTPDQGQRFREQTLEEIRSSIGLRGYKEAGLTLVWRYYSEQSGRLLAEYKFTKEDYSN